MTQEQSPTMKAIVQDVYGGPEVLHFANVPKPEPRPGDLLVQVKAISINPVDAKRRGGGPAGEPVPGAPKIVGWDAAGVVEAIGSEVQLFSVGEAVYFAGDVTRPGSYAEYVAVDERIVGRKPRSLSFEEAAAIPLTALTAWEGLFEMLGVQPDQDDSPPSLLIVGGAGGVGSIATQIAKEVGNMYVIATASRSQSEAFCRKMGADAVVNYHGDIAAQLKALGLAGVDYIFNCADLTNFPGLVACLNPLGKICSITGGEAIKSLDVSGLFGLRGTLSFELMFARPMHSANPERQGQILNQVAGLLDDGTLATTLTQVTSWEAVHEGHRAIESGRTIGKMVMTI